LTLRLGESQSQVPLGSTTSTLEADAARPPYASSKAPAAATPLTLLPAATAMAFMSSSDLPVGAAALLTGHEDGSVRLWAVPPTPGPALTCRASWCAAPAAAATAAAMKDRSTHGIRTGSDAMGTGAIGAITCLVACRSDSVPPMHLGTLFPGGHTDTTASSKPSPPSTSDPRIGGSLSSGVMPRASGTKNFSWKVTSDADAWLKPLIQGGADVCAGSSGITVWAGDALGQLHRWWLSPEALVAAGFALSPASSGPSASVAASGNATGRRVLRIKGSRRHSVTVPGLSGGTLAEAQAATMLTRRNVIACSSGKNDDTGTGSGGVPRLPDQTLTAALNISAAHARAWAACAAAAGYPPMIREGTPTTLHRKCCNATSVAAEGLAYLPCVIWEGSWRAHAGAVTSLTLVRDFTAGSTVGGENQSCSTSVRWLASGGVDGVSRLWDQEGRVAGTLDPLPRFTAKAEDATGARATPSSDEGQESRGEYTDPALFSAADTLSEAASSPQRLISTLPPSRQANLPTPLPPLQYGPGCGSGLPLDAWSMTHVAYARTFPSQLPAVPLATPSHGALVDNGAGPPALVAVQPKPDNTGPSRRRRRPSFQIYDPSLAPETESCVPNVHPGSRSSSLHTEDRGASSRPPSHVARHALPCHLHVHHPLRLELSRGPLPASSSSGAGPSAASAGSSSSSADSGRAGTNAGGVSTVFLTSVDIAVASLAQVQQTIEDSRDPVRVARTASATGAPLLPVISHALSRLFPPSWRDPAVLATAAAPLLKPVAVGRLLVLRPQTRAPSTAVDDGPNGQFNAEFSGPESLAVGLHCVGGPPPADCPAAWHLRWNTHSRRAAQLAAAESYLALIRISRICDSRRWAAWRAKRWHHRDRRSGREIVPSQPHESDQASAPSQDALAARGDSSFSRVVPASVAAALRLVVATGTATTNAGEQSLKGSASPPAPAAAAAKALPPAPLPLRSSFDSVDQDPEAEADVPLWDSDNSDEGSKTALRRPASLLSLPPMRSSRAATSARPAPLTLHHDHHQFGPSLPTASRQSRSKGPPRTGRLQATSTATTLGHRRSQSYSAMLGAAARAALVTEEGQSPSRSAAEASLLRLQLRCESGSGLPHGFFAQNLRHLPVLRRLQMQEAAAASASLSAASWAEYGGAQGGGGAQGPLSSRPAVWPLPL
jgi:hypothetical protein